MSLIQAHGGELVNLYLSEAESNAEKQRAQHYLSWDLTPRQISDIELLLNGGFSPLRGFMGQADYESVCEDMKLANGLLWPMPITLDVNEAFAGQIKAGDTIALRDLEGILIATMEVGDIWQPDKQREAELVYGTKDDSHPGVAYLMHKSHSHYVGGQLRGVERPLHYDFRALRDTPHELRNRFKKRGWSRIAAFHTRNVIHKAQHALSIRAAQQAEANLIIQPIIGEPMPGEVDRFARVRCYEHVIKEYPEATTELSLIPLATRLAGQREALWHALIRQNYGCSHFIVGHNHASHPSNNDTDLDEGQKISDWIKQYQEQCEIKFITSEELVYTSNRAEYTEVTQLGDDALVEQLDDKELFRRLNLGLNIPSWYSFDSVIDEMRRSFPPRTKQGFTLFFTGLSGAGKSTLANALTVKLMEMGGRKVTLLDGDIVRKNLSSELGFSKEHRNINVLRIGFVASEITKNGGIAVCAPIAPYTVTRRQVREMVEAVGGFVEVHVSTPIETCESRDRKGLYAKARAGQIKEFTGVSDPYEIPEKPELRIDTSQFGPDEAAQRVILKLEKLGYI